MKIADIIDEVLVRFGKNILLEGNRFCAIVEDMAPSLKLETKVLKRMNQEKILIEIYQVLSNKEISEKRERRRIEILFIEAGFSEEWKAIALNAFRLGKEVMPQDVDMKKLHKLFSEETMDIQNVVSFDSDYGRIMNIRNVVKIGNSAYKGIKDIEILIIGDGVKYIKRNAFKNCTNLKYIFFSDSIKSIASHAFGDCHALKYINFQNVNERIFIENSAFKNCDNLQLVGGSRAEQICFEAGIDVVHGFKGIDVVFVEHLIDEYLKIEILKDKLKNAYDEYLDMTHFIISHMRRRLK